MSLRVLIAGLVFFATAVALAALPLVAEGHSVNVKKLANITATKMPQKLD